jgi:curved DNA-binding protein CbpA
MLKFHPDVQPSGASEAEKERAAERSKLVTEAYRKLKSGMKR